MPPWVKLLLEPSGRLTVWERLSSSSQGDTSNPGSHFLATSLREHEGKTNLDLSTLLFVEGWNPVSVPYKLR